MNPLTREWMAKAEADLLTARREYRARKLPNFDAACFHAQQAVEKYLKAYLQENGIPIPRTHSAIELVALISETDQTFIFTQTDANLLEGFAVQFRYPGMSVDKNDAVTALGAADRVCTFVRSKISD